MSRTLVIAALLSGAVALPALAQKPAAPASKPAATATKPAPAAPAKMDKAAEMKKMQAEAKITEAAARKTALSKVPGATVASHELERENGKLIYSYDLKVAGKSGIDEVNIDAMTGMMVGKVEHESAAAEKAEAKKEAPKAPAKTGH